MLNYFLRSAINEVGFYVPVKSLLVRKCLHNAQIRTPLRHRNCHLRQHVVIDVLVCARRVTFLCRLQKLHHAFFGAIDSRVRIDLVYIDMVLQQLRINRNHLGDLRELQYLPCYSEPRAAESVLAFLESRISTKPSVPSFGCVPPGTRARRPFA
jgi:hypothetical protein